MKAMQMHLAFCWRLVCFVSFIRITRIQRTRGIYVNLVNSSRPPKPEQ